MELFKKLVKNFLSSAPLDPTVTKIGNNLFIYTDGNPTSGQHLVYSDIELKNCVGYITIEVKKDNTWTILENEPYKEKWFNTRKSWR
ncbi:MAG: hypothetical protein OIN86_13125 [Candidatus Methanoperedens sp.]|nr:hypothetical protein [Candidatus Methanoperedens sp.]CAG0949092.1 hypothetical protein METP1_00080 [Methanosarcinales archaeon]